MHWHALALPQRDGSTPLARQVVPRPVVPGCWLPAGGGEGDGGADLLQLLDQAMAGPGRE